MDANVSRMVCTAVWASLLAASVCVATCICGGNVDMHVVNECVRNVEMHECVRQSPNTTLY